MMKKFKCLASGFLMALSLSLVQGAHAAGNNDNMAADILMYVNQYRVQHGLERLSMNEAISHEAERHSHDMATHTLPFGHDGFNQRMHYLREHVIDSTSGAENVAYNYKTAKVVVDGWINSPGHRRNIMGHYNLTGIGIARDKAGRIYYTQMFLYKNAHPTQHGHQSVARQVQYVHGHRTYG